MGHVPEPVARAVVGGVVRTMAWRGGERAGHERAAHAPGAGFGMSYRASSPIAALVRRWSRRSYLEYGRYWIDGARLPYTASPTSSGADELRRGAVRQSREPLRPRGAAWSWRCPHVGSWEWGGAWLALEGMPMTAVVERVEPERASSSGSWASAGRWG